MNQPHAQVMIVVLLPNRNLKHLLPDGGVQGFRASPTHRLACGEGVVGWQLYIIQVNPEVGTAKGWRGKGREGC